MPAPSFQAILKQLLSQGKAASDEATGHCEASS
jgi:hypothetical protein